MFRLATCQVACRLVFAQACLLRLQETPELRPRLYCPSSPCPSRVATIVWFRGHWSFPSRKGYFRSRSARTPPPFCLQGGMEGMSCRGCRGGRGLSQCVWSSRRVAPGFMAARSSPELALPAFEATTGRYRIQCMDTQETMHF